jgi:hypothetical protein
MLHQEFYQGRDVIWMQTSQSTLCVVRPKYAVDVLGQYFVADISLSLRIWVQWCLYELGSDEVAP